MRFWVPVSHTSAYFSRQHFFLVYVFLSELAAVLRSFLEYTAVLKYMDIRRGVAVRCSFKEAAVSGTDQEVTGGARAGGQNKESSKASSEKVSWTRRK